MIDTVSPAQARRIALAAQGFGAARSAAGSRGETGTRQLNIAIERLGLLQLDSVNVFERSHYLPLFARLGAYDKSRLDAMTFAPRGRYIEYWAHEAAVIPVHRWPLMRWRMDANRARSVADPDSWSASNASMLDWLRAELTDRGPLPASAIEHDANKRRGPWWGLSDVKIGLETLFRWGDAVSAGRTTSGKTRFERIYALPEQVLPAEILNVEMDRHEAHRRLLAHAARAHGIGTASDLADYFRLGTTPSLVALRELADEGEIVQVAVPGWPSTAWMHRDARIPRRMDAAALLSPFDPVVWDRGRAERMFGFHYRIEIYLPAHKRVYGYYSLPILLGDRLVGRIDLKNDRQNAVLRVQSAWEEPDAPPDTAARVAELLRSAAAWQRLDRIEVTGRGSLAPALAAELAAG